MFQNNDTLTLFYLLNVNLLFANSINQVWYKLFYTFWKWKNGVYLNAQI